MGSMIGAAVVRKEDLALLTGRGVYVDNIRLPGDMAVAFLGVVSSGCGCGRGVRRSRHVDGVAAAAGHLVCPANSGYLLWVLIKLRSVD